MNSTLHVIRKKKFKQLHTEDTYWLENNIYQTINDMTKGKKSAKAIIIHEALEDYLQKHNFLITPPKSKGKKN